VLCVGSRLGETDWWARRRTGASVRAEDDPGGHRRHILGANKPATLAVLADAKLFLAALATELETRKARMNLDARRRRCRSTATSSAASARSSTRSSPHGGADEPGPRRARLSAVFPEGTTLVADGGNTAVWAMFFHEMRVRTRCCRRSSSACSRGRCPGHRRGRCAAGKPVCCIIGDGAMAFIAEIETAVRNGLQVVFLVLCDKQWAW